MSPPNSIPPPTPGVIRIHRPQFNTRFEPYQHPPAPLQPTQDSSDENCAPTSLFCNTNAPANDSVFTQARTNAGTPLRRHVSASALSAPSVASDGLWSSFTSSPATPPSSIMLTSKAQQIAAFFDLAAHEEEIEQFLQDTTQNCEAIMFCKALKLEDAIQKHNKTIDTIVNKLDELKQYVSGNWALSKAQEELLNGLLGHWLVKPLETYEKIYVRVGRYVHLRAEWLHLGVYVTDPLARQTIDKHLQRNIGQMKAQFRKEVIASLNDKKSLEDFAEVMLRKYHAPIVPGTPPQDTLAALALLRAIASGDISASHGSGDAEANKKYWPKVEKELLRLYQDGVNGSDRKNGAAWKTWEKDIIKQDHHRVARVTAGLQNGEATTSVVALPPASSVPDVPLGPWMAEDMEEHNHDPQGHEVRMPSFNPYHCSALPVNFPPETMNGNVEMAALGNVAETLENAL